MNRVVLKVNIAAVAAVVVVCSAVFFQRGCSSPGCSSNPLPNSDTVVTDKNPHHTVPRDPTQSTHKDNLTNLTAIKSGVCADKSRSCCADTSNKNVAEYVHAIGKPSDVDRHRINNASRYGDDGFEVGYRALLASKLPDVDEDVMRKMIEIGMASVYRADVLTEHYATGEISRTFLIQALLEDIRITNAECKTILTPEQYSRYIGHSGEPPSKIDVSTIQDRAMFDIFPNIQRRNPSIQARQDLYDFVSPEVVQDIVDMDEYRIRFGLRIEMQVERGEITVEEAIVQAEQQDQLFNQYVRALLSEEQQELFFGGFSSEEGGVKACMVMKMLQYPSHQTRKMC